MCEWFCWKSISVSASSTLMQVSRFVGYERGVRLEEVKFRDPCSKTLVYVFVIHQTWFNIVLIVWMRSILRMVFNGVAWKLGCVTPYWLFFGRISFRLGANVIYMF